MLACFAASWPISIIKALRTKQVAGKSPLFMLLICVGYACGVARKLLDGADWVTVLYAFNLLLVAVDLALWFPLHGEEQEAACRTESKPAARTGLNSLAIDRWWVHRSTLQGSPLHCMD